MSGVWVFNNGVVRLENPGANPQRSGARKKVLMHVPTDEVITSYEVLARKLSAMGWERYPSADPALLHFHQRSSVHLISVPADFSKFGTVHMYDIVVKSRNVFQVRDA